ncbi:MAG: NifB/NifX family molybdenum-iron cluster-binding protein [Oscillospiraceae bacterium]|nr:NifB/NifX family molybdenum-iron cluster-binding protein [Oscillospiraceae bacterium]
MRIAVAADGDVINRYFLDSKRFVLYDVEGQEVKRELSVPSLGDGQDALIQALSEYRANVLICGGLSGSTKAALGEAGILAFGGIIGKPDIAVNALLAGSLAAASDASCAESCSGSCGEESCKNCQFKN